MTALLRQACTSLQHPVLTPDGNVVKAIELSGRSGLMFIRDGQTGQVVVRQRTESWGALNDALHAND